MATIDKLMLDLPNDEELAKLPPDGGDKWNRLVFEKSPYLLQHAANPIDWYPWGEEAFAKAKAEDKPVLLSVGYSTCHWCHVMAHESFEDKSVADILNKCFVCIKVDREERPDIDNAYMAVTQALTGRGGWPMNVVMTPEKMPFFAGTYFPKHRKWNVPGVMEIAVSLEEAWHNRRDEVLTSAKKIHEMLSNPAALVGKARDESKLSLEQEELNDSLIHELMDEAYRSYLTKFDQSYGGFGQAPKFPSPHNLLFLLSYYRRNPERGKALSMVEKTLTEMRYGGIYDHIGYGFHRYSTDDKWLVPHFEKMLYDQAMLMMAYAEAYEMTGKEEYAQVLKEIYCYVSTEMCSDEGAFYSAEDADSEGEEGKFYTWSKDELIAVINSECGKKAKQGYWANKFLEIFNISQEGNYHEEASHELTGNNILHLKSSLEEALLEINKKVDIEDMTMADLEEIRMKLYSRRAQRVHPLKDDKILTDWNGLMIAALARAARAFADRSEKKELLDSAMKAMKWVYSELCDETTGKLAKRYRKGERTNNACLNDYAFMTWALLELYDVTLDMSYMEKAKELSSLMIDGFWDEKEKGFFFAPKNSKDIPIHSKEIYDGAIPSGNAIAIMSLLRLGRKDIAMECIQHFWGSISMMPYAHAQTLVALDLLLDPDAPICTEEGCA